MAMATTTARNTPKVIKKSACYRPLFSNQILFEGIGVGLLETIIRLGDHEDSQAPLLA